MQRSHVVRGKHIDVKKALSKGEMERLHGNMGNDSGRGGRGRGGHYNSGNNWNNRSGGPGGDWNVPNQGYNNNGGWGSNSSSNPWDNQGNWGNNQNYQPPGNWGPDNFSGGYQQNYGGGAIRNNFHANRPGPYGKNFVFYFTYLTYNFLLY